MTKYADRDRHLRAEALKLKANARQIPMEEWIQTFLAIVERERALAEEKTKQRCYTGGDKKRLGGRVVEVR